MQWRIWTRGLGLAAALTVAWTSGASAQSYVSPFLGYNYGGDAGCQTALGCESPASNLGIALGRGRVVGFEEELLYARDFFGKSAAQSTNLLTLMSNVVVGPRVGYLRPYGVIGIGVIKARVRLNVDDLVNSDTSLAWNLGAGLEAGGRHLRVRGDIRRVHSLGNVDIPILPIGGLKLSFNRASAGLVLAF